jgi:hypothetical protein
VRNEVIEAFCVCSLPPHIAGKNHHSPNATKEQNNHLLDNERVPHNLVGIICCAFYCRHSPAAKRGQ